MEEEARNEHQDLAHDRGKANELLEEFTESESLKKHAYAVEAAMRWYAKSLDEDEQKWAITGLLHDFDYERFPDPESGGHPYKGSEILRERGYPEEMVEAILGHALFTGVARESRMAKCLFACDELSGLITACVLVRPDKDIKNLKVKSVKKKLKDKAFARGVNRDDIRMGVEEMEVEIDQHIANVIEAMTVEADRLGLNGQ